MTCETMRGCGYRKQGGLYAVSSGGTVGGTIQTDCDFVPLRERIPLPKDAQDPGRGFVYVDGEAILDNGPAHTWGIAPSTAEAHKVMWELWGMGRERLGAGLCQDLYGTRQAMDTLAGLSWNSEVRGKWETLVLGLTLAVDDLREKLGDCPLVPAIVESRRLRWLGPILNHPEDTLAALWRLVTAISWATKVPEEVLSTVTLIMEAIDAGDDVPLLEKFRHRNKEETHGTEPDL